VPRVAEAGCSGALAWFEVHSCPAIAVGEVHTFSLTTTAAGESVLIKYLSPEAFGLIVTLEGHGVTCTVNAGPTRCDLEAAGVYTVTVNNAGENPNNYEISAAAILGSSCTALTAADLSPVAPGKPADLPDGRIANCFQFTGAADDVVRFGNAVAASFVYDATGAEVCRTDWNGSTCKLTGTAPYRAFVTQRNGTDPTFPFHLAKVNAAAGCAALPVAGFGDPGTAVLSTPLTPLQTTCRSISTGAGLYSLQLKTYPNNLGARREIYDEAGQVQCDAYGQGTCELAAAGTYTVLLESSSAEEEQTIHFAVVALDRTVGCAPEVGTSWDFPVLARSPKFLAQLDCQPISAQTGERILVQSRVQTQVVDATGRPACEDGFYGGRCLLQGTAPYRVLSELYAGEDLEDYTLGIGRLSNPTGCVPAAISKFGAVAPAGPAGSRCRELTVTTAATYKIDGRGAYDEGNEVGPYRTDGIEGCPDSRYCELQPGKYTIVAAADRPVATFPFTATDGCVDQPADSYATQSGILAGQSQYDCLRLSSPAGAQVVMLEPTGSTITEGYVIDATGKSICSWGAVSGSVELDRCTLTGTAPFRAVIHRGPYQEGQNQYRLAAARVDTASGCQAFPQSDFTAPGGVAVAVAASRFASCLAVPAAGHAGVETFEYARTGSLGSSRLLVSTADSDQDCLGRAGAAKFTFCTLTAGKAYTVLFVGGDPAAKFRVARRDITSTAKGCTAVGSTVVGATSATGTITGGAELRCYKVTGAAGDKYLVNTRDANGSIGATTFRPDGSSVCKTFGAQLCEATGSASYQVLAWTDLAYGSPGAFKLETGKFATAAGPSPECTKVASSAYGFGPLTGELTVAKTATCTAVPMAQYKNITGTAANQVSGGTNPVVRGVGVAGGPTCTWYDDADGRFDCYGWSTGTWTQTIMLTLPETETAPLKYKLGATCDTPLCGGAVFAATGFTPAAAPAGTTSTLTLAGKSLHLKDVVQLTAAGQPALTGVVKAVSADRTTATVTVDLAAAAPGARSVVVESFSGASVTLANAFTVGPRALAVVTAPTVVAPAKVGVVVKSTPGTWSPVATGYAYQWRDNGAAIKGAAGATYTPPAAMAGHKLSVTVTASRAGYTSAAATSVGVVVLAAAPVATAPPVLSGLVKVGKTLAVSTGTWSPACTSYAYQWYSGGAAVAGGTKTSLLLTAAMANKTVYAAVSCVRTGAATGRAVTKTYTVAA
jgi:hypothetical protein